MKLHSIAFILLIIGGLNWGLDVIGYNVVDMVFQGSLAIVGQIIYVLVAAAAVYEAVTHKQNCKNCTSGAATM